MARPAPKIRFIYRGEEVEPDYEQEDKCNPSTGYCNSTAVMSFTPMSRSVVFAQLGVGTTVTVVPLPKRINSRANKLYIPVRLFVVFYIDGISTQLEINFVSEGHSYKFELT